MKPAISKLAPRGLHDLLEHLAAGSTAWGSDDCACGECMQLRRAARVRAIELAIGATEES